VAILAAMGVEVREATARDAPALAVLRYEFRASIGTITEAREAFLPRCTEWMAARLAAGASWRCWVVEEAGAIRGHLWLQVVEKVPNPVVEQERHAYITNVYVEPGSRGAGAGRRLMEAAMGWCRDNGIDSAFLWPTEQSRSLYRRFGFREPDDMMEAIVNAGRDLNGQASGGHFTGS
jgi:GNAT superfamily N-acetyltransferase